jgi:hypothetical protein
VGRDVLTGRGSRAARVLITALLFALVAQAAAGTARPQPVRASSPGTGIINGSAPVPWDFAAVGGPTAATDTFMLTVQLPAADAVYYAPDLRQGSTHAAVLRIRLTWTAPDTAEALALSATDPSSTAVGNDASAATSDPNGVDVFTVQNPVNGAYTITASNFNGNTVAAVSSHAVATLQLIDLAAQPQPPQPPGALGFSNYHIPLSLMPPRLEETQVIGGRAFGEPSIGVDVRPNHDAVMYQAGLYTIRAKFDDTTQPAGVTWTDVSDVPLETTFSEDAILDVDRATGRTFVSQLTAACSAGAVSDDDGATWTSAPKPCQTPAGADHQTIGAGPFHSPLPQGAVYPSAAYYCSQNVAFGECALSLDGGLTYGTANVIFTSNDCFGLHGHVKVDPFDGTVYVPDKACGGKECLIVTSSAGNNCHPGFVESQDNGLATTWQLHLISDGHFPLYNTGDPSIGIGAHGTLYFGYPDRDGHPKITVCTHAAHVYSCSASQDVGTHFHIESTQMPTVVAGDDNRAAFAFMGSTMPGDDQQSSFVGTWHLYIAVTYDGGQTWTTSDATPDHPIQRGCIELNAARCPSTRGTNDQRNLLDFNDLTIDRQGRILAAYTDGCQPEVATPPNHGTCLTDATRLSGLPTEIEGPAIARQTCGLTLYAAFDAQTAPCALGSNVPEFAAALVLGGITTLGVAAIGRRRRRRSRNSREAPPPTSTMAASRSTFNSSISASETDGSG